jgi:molybdate transport system substrate-binding protein
MVRVVAAAVAVLMSAPSHAADTVLLHAAGSLREALDATAHAYEPDAGVTVKARYGASGLLKDEIAGGADAHVFASANMEHPRALALAGKSGPVVLFARNQLCALVRPGLAVTPATLLDRLLDPAVKVGTSTPKADPSGDYAWEAFRKAEARKPGSFALLEQKALQLTGGPASPLAPPGRSLYGVLVAQEKADSHVHPRRRPAYPGQARIYRPHSFDRRSNEMKLSARNILKGKVVDVKKGATTAHIKLDIGGQTVTAAITNEAADELKLTKGQNAYAVIKASDVMVAVD